MPYRVIGSTVEDLEIVRTNEHDGPDVFTNLNQARRLFRTKYLQQEKRIKARKYDHLRQVANKLRLEG